MFFRGRDRTDSPEAVETQDFASKTFLIGVSLFRKSCLNTGEDYE